MRKQQFGASDDPRQNIVSHIALLFGVGIRRATGACARQGLSPRRTRLGDVKPITLLNIRRDLERRFVLERLLKKSLQLQLRTRIKQGGYHYTRFLWNLPIRGQRTKSNARTARRHSLAAIPRKLYSRAQQPAAESRRQKARKRKG